MENVGCKRFADFEVTNHVFIVTGGASGTATSLQEAALR